MKRITKFQAEDGSVWDDSESAIKRDELNEQVKQIVALLPFVHDDIDFQNGKYYYQTDPKLVQVAKDKFTRLINKALSKDYEDFDKVFGRLLENDNLLYPLWFTLRNIDSSDRLWGQPYFKTYPEKGEQIEYQEYLKTQQ